MSFNIDKEELRAAVFKQHYISATASLGKVKRYWFSASRPAASMLIHLIESGGTSVILHNAPRRWEFVVYMADSNFGIKELNKLALERHELMENGIAENELPV
ncbi:hypothetical protein [Pantoea agglomerans]|uniref:hypothetical protein n=1 Tax=Enterobacter agglomerans TaxID=549 RepID=UPI002B1D2080|nr:hypothetical protein [Pantoea agglomerans]